MKPAVVRSLLLLVLLWQGLMLWHNCEHPLHGGGEPPCVIHQLAQASHDSLPLLLVALVLCWRALRVSVPTSPYLQPLRRPGGSRAPPLHLVD